MAFNDFLESQRNPAPVRESQYEAEERDNYEERAPQRKRQMIREGYDEEDSKALDEVEFYKERLYKKIDSCFIRYGLAGLKKIDEGIAEALSRYINGLKGESREPVREAHRPFRRPERVRYEEDVIEENEEEIDVRQPARTVQEQVQRPFKKPTRIEGSNPNSPIARRPGEPKLESGAFNPELLNAILTDVIPPTEIHPVEVNSSIPRPVQKEAISSNDVEMPAVEEDSRAFESVEEPTEAEANYDIAKDMLAGVETENVDLFVPPVIEEVTEENYVSDEELDAPIVENIKPEAEPTPEVAEPKKKKKRK